MPKHTSGPWTVENPMEFELAIVEAGKETHEWRFIAACPLPAIEDEDDYSPRFTTDEVEANARLIAAAPELLAACELWDQGFAEGEEFSPEQFLQWVNANRRAARLAIAKAKGVDPDDEETDSNFGPETAAYEPEI